MKDEDGEERGEVREGGSREREMWIRGMCMCVCIQAKWLETGENKENNMKTTEKGTKEGSKGGSWYTNTHTYTNTSSSMHRGR